MKFGRRCQLRVEVNPSVVSGSDFTEGRDSITIPEELSIEFEISRQALASSQTGTFRIYNLGEKTRNLIFRDPYELTYRAIQFRAGYEDDPFLPLCFNGFISSAVSYREGVDFITEIRAYDGGLAMATGFTSQTLVAGESAGSALKRLVSHLPGVRATPIIGSFPATSLRDRTLFGNTWNVILEESNGLATIDNGQVKILNYNEAIQAEIPVITSASGLLGSPRRGATKLEFDMIFEPRFTLGQIIQLDSSTNRRFNGLYKVQGFSHRGLISPSVAGDCSTNVSLFFGPGEFTEAQLASGRQTVGPYQIVEGSVVQ